MKNNHTPISYLPLEKLTNRGNGNPNIVDDHIKYLVGEVNKEFDIDINIEIEIAYQKAIVRGEKPSIRLAIKEF